MPRYSENAFANLLLNLPGLQLGRRREALRNAGNGHPTAAIGALFPWAYNPEHGGGLGENIASRLDGFGDNLRNAWDQITGGDSGYTPQPGMGIMPNQQGWRPGAPRPQNSWEAGDGFPQMGWEQDNPLYGNGQGMMRGPASGPSRGTGSLGQHAGVISGQAAVDFARGLATNITGSSGTHMLNEFGRRIKK